MDRHNPELKRLKRAYKDMKKKSVPVWAFATVLTLILCLLFTSLSIGVKAFDNAVASALGGSFWRLAKKDAHADYFPKDFSTPEALEAYAETVRKQVASESAVLMMNTDNVLPLKSGATVSLFFDVPFDSESNWKTAFEKAGLSVSDTDADTAVVVSTKNQETLDLLQLLYSKKTDGQLQKIILLICAPNGTQIGYTKDNRLDGVLWLGEAKDIDVVAQLLTGKVNPSGRLAETYLHSANIPASATAYTLGIYTDYKYYETRYEDHMLGTGNAGKFVYQTDVAYPFGFGLSYTTFAYSDMAVVYDGHADRFEVTLTVSNTGSAAGKETVQVYAQTPYTDYDKEHHIEKASVNLVGFAKTKLLQPGESETVTVFVDKRDLASYDQNGAGTYILDAGDYYLTAATNAHNAINNILAAKGCETEGSVDFTYKWVLESLDTVTYATAQNGSPITNRFSVSDESATWVSRQDWEGTLSQASAPAPQLPAALQNRPYSPADYPTVAMPTMGARNGLKLYNMRGLAFNDPLWQSLLDQLTFDEMLSLVADGYGWRMPVESVQAPGGRCCDEADYMPVSSRLLATTFNAQLAYDVGNAAGNLCLYNQVTNLSISGCDSAESFLSGKLSARLILGVQDKGVDVLIKSFSQDSAVWLNEQTAREQYLRTYQYALWEGQAGGIVASANRFNFVSQILRGEWGSRGMVVTEASGYTAAADNLMEGTTVFSICSPKIAKELTAYKNDPVIVSALRQACHYNLYATANGSAMNGIGEKTVVKVRQLFLVPICIIVAIISGLLCIGFGVMWYLRNEKFKQSYAYRAYKTLKEETE